MIDTVANMMRLETIISQLDVPEAEQTTTRVFEILHAVLSQLTSEVINSQRVRTELDTTTNMLVQDGQTIMLSGMLFQEDTRVTRKIPLLSDLPLVGGLFQHNQGTAANCELLIFVTPHVISVTNEMLPQAREELAAAQQKLQDIREEPGPPDTNAVEWFGPAPCLFPCRPVAGEGSVGPERAADNRAFPDTRPLPVHTIETLGRDRGFGVAPGHRSIILLPIRRLADTGD